jgi:hypothetical protein
MQALQQKSAGIGIEPSGSGDLLSMAQVGELLGMPGRPAAASTVRRWVEPGILVLGERVKLAATRRPGGLVFTRRDVERFYRELQGRDAGGEADFAEDLKSGPGSGVGVYPE